MSGQPAILPEKPTVPFGAIDPATGKQLECTEWFIFLGAQGADDPLCEMEYARFLSLISKDKTARYDGNHFLLSALTEEEIKALADG